MIYFQLFISFFQVGLFSIGGGYAALPLIQNQIVELHSFMTMGEFTDLITIAEMTPGRCNLWMHFSLFNHCVFSCISLLPL